MQQTSFEPASFGARLAAMIIDNILFSIALSPLLLMIFGQKTYTQAEFQEILNNQGLMGLYTPGELLITHLLILGITMFFWVKFAGTPAKRWLKLRVVDAKTGKNLTAMQSTLRYVGYFVSGLPFGLGFFWMLFDKNQQTWHDKIAGTMVIKDNGNHRSNLRSNDNGDNQRQRPVIDKDDDFVA